MAKAASEALVDGPESLSGIPVGECQTCNDYADYHSEPLNSGLLELLCLSLYCFFNLTCKLALIHTTEMFYRIPVGLYCLEKEFRC